MAVLDLAGQRAQVQRLLALQDSVAPPVPSPDLDAFINEAIYDLRTKVSPRKKLSESEVTFSPNDSHRPLGTIWADVLEVSLNATKKPLERTEPEWIRYLGGEYSNAGTPTHWSAERNAGTATGTWELYLWPPPSASTPIDVFGKLEPTLLVIDTDKMDGTDQESYLVCDIAAARLAAILGYEATYVESLWRPVGEDLQAALGRASRITRPRPTPEAVA